MRGYCGVALYEPKTIGNFAVAMRSAHCFGADFISLIGARYGARDPADTTDVGAHIPIFQHLDRAAFMASIPPRATLVSIEVDGDRDLGRFVHPTSSVYVFGGEDRTLPAFPGLRVRIPTKHCLNLGMAVTCVLYDRARKLDRFQRVQQARMTIAAE